MSTWNQTFNNTSIIPQTKCIGLITQGLYSTNWDDITFADQDGITGEFNIPTLGLNNWLLCEQRQLPANAYIDPSTRQASSNGTLLNVGALTCYYDNSYPSNNCNIISIVWDMSKKSYATDFVVYMYYTAASGKSSVTKTVSGNNSYISYVSIDTEYMDHVAVRPTKWVLPNDYCIIRKVDINYILPITNENLKQLTKTDDNSIFSNNLIDSRSTLQIYNANDDYNPTNPSAKFKGVLKRWGKVQYNFYMDNGATYYGFIGYIDNVSLTSDHNYIKIEAALGIDLCDKIFDFSNLTSVFPFTTTDLALAEELATQYNIPTSLYYEFLQIRFDTMGTNVDIKSNTGFTGGDIVKLAILGTCVTVQDRYVNNDGVAKDYYYPRESTANYLQFETWVANSTTVDNDFPNLDMGNMKEDPRIEVKEHIYSVNINNGEYIATDPTYSDKGTLELTYPITDASGMSKIATSVLDLYNKYNKRISGKFVGNPDVCLDNTTPYKMNRLPMITTQYGTYPFFPTHVEITFDGSFSGTFEAILCQEDS